MLDRYKVFNLVLHIILFHLFFNLFHFLRLEDVVDQLGLSLRQNALIMLKVEHFDRLFWGLLIL